MAIRSLLLWLCSICLGILSTQNCVFNDNENLLDLRPMQNLRLTYTQGKFTFNYAICANDLSCEGDNVMLSQVD